MMDLLSVKGRLRAPFVILCALLWAQSAAAQEPRFALPIDCTLGSDCYVQLYVDRDPGPGFADIACGRLSYDGHTGTDFAVPTLRDMGRGVDVLAAAPGVVTATRDGMADISQETPDAPSVDQRGCGNAVILNHGDGWQTQYCHLRLGTVTVAEGDRVQAGTVLGQVGLSGNTTFPHLEFILRHNGEVLDPFRAENGQRCTTDGTQLWQDPIPYRGGGLLALGFGHTAPPYDAITLGLPTDGIRRQDRPITLWSYLFGALPGDEISARVTDPGGVVIIDASVALDRPQYRAYRPFSADPPPGGWPAGAYSAEVTLHRDGAAIDSRRVSADLP